MIETGLRDVLTDSRAQSLQIDVTLVITGKDGRPPLVRVSIST